MKLSLSKIIHTLQAHKNPNVKINKLAESMFDIKISVLQHTIMFLQQVESYMLLYVFISMIFPMYARLSTVGVETVIIFN